LVLSNQATQEGNMTTTAEQLARNVGGEVVQAQNYSRIVLGGRTLVYVNTGFLDFRASRAKLTQKGNRATLPISETRAAATLVKHVAELA
jgi:hypothetical protein